MKRFTRNADEPITEFDQDKFNRKDFAKALGEALIKVPRNQPMTVGLYGPWGSGKTSIINMATQYLAGQYKDKVILVKFNPWMFSNPESLHGAFFKTLARALDKNLETNGKKIAKQLEKYGEVTSSVGIVVGALFPHFSVIAAAASRAGGLVIKNISSNYANRNSDADAMRTRLNRLLEESGTRIIVIIDDIDRLDGDEVHQIFKLVKNVAHFNNVSYLLSFDRNIVKEVLAIRYLENPKVGGDFVDKIVQLPLYIPSLNDEQLNNYFSGGVQEIIQSHTLNVPEDDMSRFQTAFYLNGAARLFITPRQIVRYLNALDFSLERLGREASFTDVALIELLRIFYPKTYDNLTAAKSIILRNGSDDDRSDDAKSEAQRLIFGDDDPHGIELSIVRQLFPSASWMFGGAGLGERFEIEWENLKRVCTYKYFDRYFMYGFPPGDIPDSYINNFLDALNSKKVTSRSAEGLFNALIKDADISLILSKIQRSKDDLSEKQSLILAMLLVNRGADLPRTVQPLAGDATSPYMISVRLAADLVSKVNNPASLLKDMLNTPPLGYAWELFSWVKSSSDSKSDSKSSQRLTSSQLQSLEKGLALRIKKYAVSHHLQREFPDEAAELIWLWNKWGNQADINRYFARNFKNDPRLAVEFLMSFLGKGRDLLHPGRLVRIDLRREHYESISDTIDPTILMRPLIEIFGEEVQKFDSYPDNRSNEDKEYEFIAAAQFLRLHNTLKNNSK